MNNLQAVAPAAAPFRDELPVHPAVAECLAQMDEAERQHVLAELLPFWKPLFRFAVKLSGDPVFAEDLVQETYLKACRYADRYHLGSNPRAWLFQILKNVYINHYRRTRYMPVRVSEHELFLAGARHQERSGSLDHSLERRNLSDEVARALQSLPVEYRIVVVLCDLEDFSYEEIAQIADVPLGTVRSRLHRGRKHLRARLLDYALAQGYSPAEPAAEPVAPVLA